MNHPPASADPSKEVLPMADAHLLGAMAMRTRVPYRTTTTTVTTTTTSIGDVSGHGDDGTVTHVSPDALPRGRNSRSVLSTNPPPRCVQADGHGGAREAPRCVRIAPAPPTCPPGYVLEDDLQTEVEVKEVKEVKEVQEAQQKVQKVQKEVQKAVPETAVHVPRVYRHPPARPDPSAPELGSASGDRIGLLRSLDSYRGCSRPTWPVSAPLAAFNEHPLEELSPALPDAAYRPVPRTLFDHEYSSLWSDTLPNVQGGSERLFLRATTEGSTQIIDMARALAFRVRAALDAERRGQNALRALWGATLPTYQPSGCPRYPARLWEAVEAALEEGLPLSPTQKFRAQELVRDLLTLCHPIFADAMGHPRIQELFLQLQDLKNAGGPVGCASFEPILAEIRKYMPELGDEQQGAWQRWMDAYDLGGSCYSHKFCSGSSG